MMKIIFALLFSINAHAAYLNPSTISCTQSGSWSSVGVTGTFWQATQPVSGPLTDTQIRATPLPVSGTFWQATQPVSIASMPSTPVTGSFYQTTQPVSPAGGSTFPVSLASLPALAAGSAVIGHVLVDSAPTTAVTGTVTTIPAGSSTWPVSLVSVPTHAVTGSGNFITIPAGSSTWPVSVSSMPFVTTIPAGASTWPVSLASVPTHAVTGSGNFITIPAGSSTWPVSIASMPSTPVTGTVTTIPAGASTWPVSGTFYQATQPISGTVTTIPAGSSTWPVSLAAETTKVIGTVNISAGQTVGVIVNGSLPAGGATIGIVSAKIQDGSGNLITSTTLNSQRMLDVYPVLGFSTASNTRVPLSLGAGSSTLLVANTNRKYAYIMNQSNYAIYIKLGATAVASEGIAILPGGIFELTGENLWRGIINGITNSSNSVNIDVFEGTP